MGRDLLRAFAPLAALGVAGLTACGGGGDKSSDRAPSATTAGAVQATCGNSFAPTAEIRQAILRQEYVDIGPLTFLSFRELAAAKPISARSLKVLVIATPGAGVTVTIDARDRSRAGFLRFPADDVDPLPPDARPRFEIQRCTNRLLSRRSLAYEMTWAVASPGCVHFTVREAGQTARPAAIPFGGGKRC